LVHVKFCYDSVNNQAYGLSVLHSNSKDRYGLDGAQQSGTGAALADYSHNSAEVSQGSPSLQQGSWLGILVLWLIIPQSMGNFQIRCTFIELARLLHCLLRGLRKSGCSSPSSAKHSRPPATGIGASLQGTTSTMSLLSWN